MANTIVKYHDMDTTVTIDRAGRVIIPKPLRDELRLEAGDTLQLESDGEHVTLRPIRTKSPLRKERGVWVFHGSGTLSVRQTAEMIANAREERSRDILGEKR
jgi:AbrB family looped-hinge helix DNA binding protein